MKRVVCAMLLVLLVSATAWAGSVMRNSYLRDPLDPVRLDPRIVFYAPMRAHTNDLVSGVGATFTRAGSGRYRTPAGTFPTAVVSQPRFDWSTGYPALLLEPTSSNYYPNSDTPANASVSLTAGSWTLSTTGTGSIAIAAGTATGSGWGSANATSSKTVTVTVGGTVNLTVSGAPSTAQLEPLAFNTSYIANIGTGSTSRASEAGVASPYNGMSWSLSSLHPGVSSAISPGGQGTLIVEVIPGLTKGYATIGGQGIVGVKNHTVSLLRFTTNVGSFYTSDSAGTQISLSSINFYKGTKTKVMVSWGPAGQKIWQDGVAGSTGTYSGSFASDGKLWIGYGVTWPFQICNVKIANFQALSWAEAAGL